jgi:ubiquinol-cytochrome c reductase cytochrome c subunit
MALSSHLVFNSKGQLVLYGDKYVKYILPPDALIPLGEALYQQNCQACHGVTADGVPPPGTPGGAFPNLLGLGPATYDFWIESGRMPAASTTAVEAPRGPPKLNHLQALAISAYLNSLDPATPLIPYPVLAGANLSDGAALFALNCAACHTITGDGDALAYDTFAPSMRDVPATQVAEALRTGPANMPVFTGNLTDKQLRDVVAYVTEKIQHPENPGGLGLGGLGPVGEGFIGLALGVGLLALLGFWVGDRT